MLSLKYEKFIQDSFSYYYYMVKKKKSHQIYIVYEDGNFIGFSTFPQFTYYEGLWDVFFFFDEYIEIFFPQAASIIYQIEFILLRL